VILALLQLVVGLFYQNLKGFMGNKYTIYTFNIEEGNKYYLGTESLSKAIWSLYKLKLSSKYGCIYLEIR